jgi:hypothetical protein
MIQIGQLHKTHTRQPLTKSSAQPMRVMPSEYKLEENNVIRDVIQNLDSDTTDVHTNLTTIDFNTRLRSEEIGSIVALQMLHTLRVGGSECSLIARSIKRHKVSLKGLGREEKVRIIQGEREHEKSQDTSLFGKIKGFLGKKDE